MDGVRKRIRGRTDWGGRVVEFMKDQDKQRMKQHRRSPFFSFMEAAYVSPLGEIFYDNNYNTSLLFFELHGNAIEHGSRWCLEGDVVVRVQVSAQGVLAFIDQPLGFAESKLRELEKGVLVPQDKVYRGRGLPMCLDSGMPEVNFLSLDSGGARTVIFLTEDILEREGSLFI